MTKRKQEKSKKEKKQKVVRDEWRLEDAAAHRRQLNPGFTLLHS